MFFELKNRLKITKKFIKKLKKGLAKRSFLGYTIQAAV